MLTGRQVRLRPRVREDVETLYVLQSDVESYSLTSAEPFEPRSLAVRQAEFDRRQTEPDPTAAFFVIERLDDDTHAAIGSVGLWGIDLHNSSAHIGLSLLPQVRGQGLGRDALEVICEFGFTVRGLHRLALETLELNVAMRATAAACGFVEEGRLRSSAWYLGRRVDDVLYGLLAPEWLARRS